MSLRGAKSRFSWQTLSLDGKPVRAGGGQVLAVDGAIGKRGAFDAIIVPGSLIDHVTAERLQPQYQRAGAWLRQQHAGGKLVGAFLQRRLPARRVGSLGRSPRHHHLVAAERVAPAPPAH